MTASATPLDQPLPGASFAEAIARYWKKAFVFTGRASRSELWKVALVNGGIGVILYVLLMIALVGFIVSVNNAVMNGGGGGAPTPFLIIMIVLLGLWGLANIVPGIAVGIRRLHDTDKSGFTLFYGLIPAAGGIILLVFFASPSLPQGARFDAAPGTRSAGPKPGSAPSPVPPAPVAPFQPAAYEPEPWPPAPSAAPTATQPGTPIPPAPFVTETFVPSPFAEPEAAPAAPTSASPFAPVESRFTPPAPPTRATPVVSPFAPADPELERTQLRAPGAAVQFALVLPDGRSLPVNGALVFGRDPIADAEHPAAVSVPVVDPAMSVSKTHAVVAHEGAQLVVTDLNSTNGTTVTEPGGRRIVLAPGKPQAVAIGSTIALGDYELKVTPAR